MYLLLPFLLLNTAVSGLERIASRRPSGVHLHQNIGTGDCLC